MQMFDGVLELWGGGPRFNVIQLWSFCQQCKIWDNVTQVSIVIYIFRKILPKVLIDLYVFFASFSSRYFFL